MRRLLSILGGALALSACAPNTDITVAPPRVTATYDVEVPAAQPDGRLPGWARPLRYKLQLEIDPASNRFSGQAQIDVELDQPTGAIIMHAADLTIEGAEVLPAIVGASAMAVDTELREAAGARNEREELVITASSELPAGETRVLLKYSGPLEESLRGVYRVADGGDPYVFTQFEPSDARRLFPSFDDPIHKVPFDVSIAVPQGQLAVFNTPEVSRREDGKRTVFTFATTERLPTYLVALAVGPLDVVEGPADPVPLRLVAAKGKAAGGQLALDESQILLRRLGRWFGRPYPYAKLDLVAVPNFGPGAMENAGLVTFREELLLVDAKTSSAKARRDMRLTLAHELAHQWFGNLVTMRWWDDLWLNEGFATYMESVIVDELEPTTRAELELLGYIGRVMELDALDAARQVRQPVANTYEAAEAFDGITYIKGAAVIRMIHRFIGDDAFRNGVRSYLTRHAWSNATATDLFEAMDASSGKDVAAVASTFLDQPGLPLVTATPVCEQGQPPRVTLQQRRYRGRLRDAESATWRIPVCVSYATGRGRSARIARTCDLLRGTEQSFELEGDDCPVWLLPNADHAGYYRYALPTKDLAALGNVVPKLDAGTRLGFLTNLWALVQAEEIEGSQLVEQLLAMKGERDREVLSAVVRLLGHVSDALVEPEARAAFAKLVSAVLMPTFKRLGWDAKKGDAEQDRLLRRDVLAALAVFSDDPRLLHDATDRARRWLDDPAGVDADTAVVALRMATRRGRIGFDRLLKAHNSAKATHHRVIVVQAMGSLPARALAQALDRLADGTIKAQDGVYLARTAADWPDSRRQLVDWLGDHLAALAKSAPGFGVARLIQPVGRLCEAATRDAANARLRPVLQAAGASERRLDEALQRAELCIDLRRRQAAAVSAHLQQKRRF